MKNTLPATPGNMKSASKALALLEQQLHNMNIHPFEWPQNFDSGIDLIGFATLNRKKGDKSGAATPFLAGFQAKGTDDYFTNEQVRSVQIKQHEDYWMRATLPVFVAKISNDGEALLIEDALSSLHGLALVAPYEDRLKSIPTTTSIESAATDIRLRMFAHALAHWISQRLRARTLSHEDDFLGLNRQSAWSLLDYPSGRFSSFPVPGSWADVEQYFTLVDYLYDDWTFRNQLFEDLRKRRHQGTDETGYGWDGEFIVDDGEKESVASTTGAFRLLGGMVELLLRFESLHRTLTSEPKPNEQTLKASNARLAIYKADENLANLISYQHAEEAHTDPKRALARRDVEDAITVITEVWDGAASELNCSPEKFAEEVMKFGGQLSGAASKPIHEVASTGVSLKTALQNALKPWAGEAFYTRHWDVSVEVP